MCFNYSKDSEETQKVFECLIQPTKFLFYCKYIVCTSPKIKIINYINTPMYPWVITVIGLGLNLTHSLCPNTHVAMLYSF